MTANEELRDNLISHAVYFERYKTHEVNQLFKIIDAANRAAKAEIQKTDGAATKARYQAIMKKIGQISAEARESIDGQLRLDLMDLIESESAFLPKAITSAVGVDLEMVLPAPKQVFTAATFMPFSASATFESMLIDIDKDLYSQWDMSVRVGYLTGETAQVINRRVLGSISGLQVGTMTKYKRDLEANTRTLLAHYADQTRKAVYRENEDIIQGYQRLETLDPRTCLVCGVLDGKVYKRLEDDPGVVHMRCVLGDTKVSSGSKILAASRRAYEGDIIIIRTAAGNLLRVTPNHPILTDSGFVSAQNIRLGQNLICNDRINRVGLTGEHDNNVESSIEELFHTFVQSGEMSTRQVPITSKDFHGDGTDEEVAIIACNRILPDMKNVSFLKKLLQRIFVGRTQACTVFKSCNRPFMKFFFGLFSTSCSCVSSFRKVFYFIGGSPLHSLKLLLTRVSKRDISFSKIIQDIRTRNVKRNCDTANANATVVDGEHIADGRSVSGRSSWKNLVSSLNKPCINSFSIYAELARDIINGNSGPIKIDQVVDIKSSVFSGHVYNLQTDNEWFIANNIITHNCRGLCVPILKGWEGLGITERASVDGVVPGTTTYEEWLKKQSVDRQKDILGPSRYELFKNGAPLKGFTVDGKAMTLAQWKQVQGNTEKYGTPVLAGGGIKKSDQTRRDAHANVYYEELRNRKEPSDVKRVSSNTGFSENEIKSIRDHVFTDTHVFDEGVKARFAPDFEIAEAWQRMDSGKVTDNDLVLLRHELKELTLMREKGYTYEKAHEVAHKDFPWAELIKGGE